MYRHRVLYLLVLALWNCTGTDRNHAHIPIPAELRGSWSADDVLVTTRTHPPNQGYQFHSDTIQLSIEVHDTFVEGKIGLNRFYNAPLRINGGNPERNGIQYIVECGYIGKIFPGDPRDSTKVTLEIGPAKNGSRQSGLRYTQGGAKFPMAGFTLIRTANTN